MKFAKRNQISDSFKENKELRKALRNDAFISPKEVIKITGFKACNEHKYMNISGMIYCVTVDDKVNAKNIVPWAETFAKKEKDIAAHEDKEYATLSDAGGYLINGLLFSNNYGDGTNAVIVRKFLKETRETSRAEIYDKQNCQIVYTHNGVKVWKHDCEDINTPPLIDEPNAFKICVHGRKLYIFVKGW